MTATHLTAQMEPVRLALQGAVDRMQAREELPVGFREPRLVSRRQARQPVVVVVHAVGGRGERVFAPGECALVREQLLQVGAGIRQGLRQRRKSQKCQNGGQQSPRHVGPRAVAPDWRQSQGKLLRDQWVSCAF